jgi:hypothetical protein
MKKYLYLAFAFCISLLFVSNVSAQTITIDGSASGTTQLSGSLAGNKQSFDVDLNLATISKDLVINSAILQFTTSQSSTSGYVKIIDRYKSVSTNLIDTVALTSAGQKQTANILANVNDWYTNSSTNYGVSFISQNFTDNDSITFTGIKLVIEASDKDITPPNIVNMDITKIDLVTYNFSIQTDEASKIVINLGKTSVYDQTSPVEAAFLTLHEISFTSLQNGVTYHYQVVVTDASGNVLKTTDATFLTDVTFTTQSGTYVQDNSILPPNNLSQELAKKSGKYSALLSWTPSITDGVEGYVLFRKNVDSINYIEITKLSPTTLSYLDETVEAGIKYDYMLSSYIGNKISYDSAKVQIAIPADSTTESDSTPQTTFNTGQVFLILFVVAVFAYIAVYLLIKYMPKLFVKKSGKEPLKNILNDPARYEETVTSEFGTQADPDTDYPKSDPVAGRDMN